MAEFLQQISLFPLVLTLGAFQVGLWCQKKWRSAIFNPLLIAVIIVISVLILTSFSPVTYQSGTSALTWLLTPATVALAIPLYHQLKVLRKNLFAILIGVIAGTLAALFGVLILCKLFCLQDFISVSVLPKSITTAIGIVLSEQNGGITALTTLSIMISGIFGNLAGSTICKFFRIRHPIAQGAALGTASHMVGTAKANELGQLQGAVRSLSLAVAGILTAVLFPVICMLL